jgi:hypothetical protein
MTDSAIRKTRSRRRETSGVPLMVVAIIAALIWGVAHALNSMKDLSGLTAEAYGYYFGGAFAFGILATLVVGLGLLLVGKMAKVGFVSLAPLYIFAAAILPSVGLIATTLILTSGRPSIEDLKPIEEKYHAQLAAETSAFRKELDSIKLEETISPEWLTRHHDLAGADDRVARFRALNEKIAKWGQGQPAMLRSSLDRSSLSEKQKTRYMAAFMDSYKPDLDRSEQALAMKSDMANEWAATHTFLKRTRWQATSEGLKFYRQEDVVAYNMHIGRLRDLGDRVSALGKAPIARPASPAVADQ